MKCESGALPPHPMVIAADLKFEYRGWPAYMPFQNWGKRESSINNLDGFAGLNTSLVPMYISEIAPLTLRGGLGTVNQLAVTVGLLISQILGIEGLLGTDDGWPILLGFAVIPVKINLITTEWGCWSRTRVGLISQK